MAVFGFDIGGTHLRAIRLAEDGSGMRKIAWRHVLDMPDNLEGLLAVLPQILEESRQEDSKSKGPDVAGVGCAGLITKEGVVGKSPNISWLDGVDLKTEIESSLDMPIYLDNDLQAAAYAEFKSRKTSDLLLVCFGTGIGAGRIEKGELLQGANNFWGEAGHMRIAADTPLCGCGERGCWEQMASGNALGRMGREAAAEGKAENILQKAGGDIQMIRGEHVSSGFLENDPEAEEIMREYTSWMALGLYNLICVCDPETVVIGGGVAEAGQKLLDLLRVSLLKTGSYRDTEKINLELTKENTWAGSIGAALLADKHLKT